MRILSRGLPPALALPIALALPLALAAARHAPPGAGLDDDDHYVAVKCGKLITGTGEEKENVTLLIKNGKVELIGEKVELPHPCEVIDAGKQVVMPGHIHPHSRISLMEFQRNGMRADLKVADEFLPVPDSFDVALAAGFTTLHLVPPGASGIPGRGMVIRTADLGGGYAVDDDGPVKVNLIRPEQDRRTFAEALSGAKREIEKADKARADWEKKKKEAEEAKKKEEEAKKQQAGTPPVGPPQPGGPPPAPAPAPTPTPKADDPPKPQEPPKPEAKPEQKVEEFQPPPIPPPLQPFVDLIQKKPGALAFVRLGGATSYLHFLEVTKEYEIAHVLMPDNPPARGRPQAFFGVPGGDLQWVAKQFGEHKELVVLTPNLAYIQASVNLVNSPNELLKAGARVAFTPASDTVEELNSFRFNVNEVIKGGMKRADAIAGMTKNAADAVGLGDRLGTLEPGKDANLLFLSADPFDVQAMVERVVIEGQVVWSRTKKMRS